jgi:hypothetical protein
MEGMRSQLENNKVDAFVKQVEVMEKLRDVCVRRMGVDKDGEQIVHLMSQLPNLEPSTAELSILATPARQLEMGEENVSPLFSP